VSCYDGTRLKDINNFIDLIKIIWGYFDNFIKILEKMNLLEEDKNNLLFKIQELEKSCTQPIIKEKVDYDNIDELDEYDQRDDNLEYIDETLQKLYERMIKFVEEKFKELKENESLCYLYEKSKVNKKFQQKLLKYLLDDEDFCDNFVYDENLDLFNSKI
jgi:hypothetical protein